jgi:hypothetical protein
MRYQVFLSVLFNSTIVYQDYTVLVACTSMARWRNDTDRVKTSVKVDVKCTLAQALRLCTGRTAHRGSRGIVLLIHGHGIRRG